MKVFFGWMYHHLFIRYTNETFGLFPVLFYLKLSYSSYFFIFGFLVYILFRSTTEVLGHRVCLWSTWLILPVFQEVTFLIYFLASGVWELVITSSPSFLADAFKLYCPLVMSRFRPFFICWLIFRIFSLEKWLFKFFLCGFSSVGALLSCTRNASFILSLCFPWVCDFLYSASSV